MMTDFTRFNIFALAQDRKNLSPDLLARDICICFVAIEGSTPVFTTDASSTPLSRAEVSQVYGCSLGAIAFSQSGMTELKKILSQWTPSGQTAPADYFFEANSKKGSQEELNRWIQSRLVSLARVAALQTTQLHRSLFAIRKEHDHMQRAFTALESFVSRNVSAGDAVTFVAEPSEQHFPTLAQFAAHASPAIEQLLPVPSTGFSGLDLNFKLGSECATGTVVVRLYTAASKRTICEWHLPYTDIAEGWNTLSVTRTDKHEPETVGVHIEWKSDADSVGEPPRIALSALNPLPEYRLQRTGAGKAFATSLAFRTHEYVPGLRPPRVLGAFRPIEMRSDSAPIVVPDHRSWKVTPDHFKKAKAVGKASRLGRDSELIRPLDDASRLLVHPKESGISAAILERVCPADVERVTAHVMTEHSGASDIYYGLAVVPAGVKFKQELDDALIDQLGMNFSGWHQVRPSVKTQLHLFLSSPTEAASSVLLMTRLSPDGTTQNAWSTFQSIEFVPPQRAGE